MNQMSTPSSDRIRLTISVTPEVYEVFTRFAEASGHSLGRCMGDWLADTSEAAEMMSALVSEAREKPRQVARQLQGMATGLVHATEDLLTVMRNGSRPEGRGTAAGAFGARGRLADLVAPRPVIRGGKSPRAGKKGGRS